MSADQDHGVGDDRLFSAEDLERLYRLNGPDGVQRIRGKELNRMLNTKVYKADAWYAVTKGIVEKL